MFAGFFLWVGGLIYRLPLGSGLTDRALPKSQGVVLRRVRSPHVSKGSSLGFFNSIDEIIRSDRRSFIATSSPYLRAGYGHDPQCDTGKARRDNCSAVGDIYPRYSAENTSCIYIRYLIQYIIDATLPVRQNLAFFLKSSGTEQKH